jgi:peroxiredoxin
MKYYISILCITLSLNVLGQKQNSFAPSTFLIRGHIKNSSASFLEFFLTSFFEETKSQSMLIDKKGNFSKSIRIMGDAQNLNLLLNKTLSITVQKNDTIEINWDANDFINTISVINHNPEENRALQTELSLYKLYNDQFDSLRKESQNNSLTDSVRFANINRLYNKELESFYGSKLGIEHYMMSINIYFKYTNLLFEFNLLPSFDLKVNDTTGKPFFAPIKIREYYKTEIWDAFKDSPIYRSFLFNYLRGTKLTNLGFLPFDPEDKRNDIAPFAPAWQDYYSGLANLRYYEIRDWFIANSIMFDFEYYSFDNANAIYKDFISRIKTSFYTDTLKAYFAQVQRIKPGTIAPDIILKNDHGKIVSLRDFAGKVVYIDFWGVSCSSCLQEFKMYAASVRAKYQNANVVFLNVCVDTDEKTWKENLSRLKIGGINLIAPGWINNPVCKAYGIDGLPHYLTIDANGKIADNNSPRPSESYDLDKELDKLIH